MVLSRAALGLGQGFALLGAGCQFVAGITGDLVLGSRGVGGAGASSSAGTGGGGEAVSRFAGPGTPGVGICEAGTKTCNQDGMGYGPCMGQVPPKTETCADMTDEDCDGHECALWSTYPDGMALLVGQFKGSIDSGVGATTSDGANAELATTVATTIDVGAGPLTPQGSTDLLIARFAP